MPKIKLGTVQSTFLRWMTSLYPGWNWFVTLRPRSFSGVQVSFSHSILPVFLACVLRLFPPVLRVVSLSSRLIVSPGVPVVSFLHSEIVSPQFPKLFPSMLSLCLLASYPEGHVSQTSGTYNGHGGYIEPFGYT